MADTRELSDVKRKELDDYYLKQRHKLPACPTCKTNNDVIHAVRGKPTSDLLLYAQEGHVKLSGCTQGFHGWCKKCDKFF